MSGMKKTRPEAPNDACLRPDVCQDLTSACARSACQGEKRASAVGLSQPALQEVCLCVRALQDLESKTAQMLYGPSLCSDPLMKEFRISCRYFSLCTGGLVLAPCCRSSSSFRFSWPSDTCVSRIVSHGSSQTRVVFQMIVMERPCVVRRAFLDCVIHTATNERPIITR